MVTILAVVTSISLVLTLALIVVVMRLLRGDRQRSDARAAALAQLAAIDEPADDPRFTVMDPIEEPAAIPLAAAPAELFTVREQRSAWPWRLGVVAALALLVVTIGIAFRVLTPSKSAATVAAEQQSSSQAASGLLELMSLKHAQQGDALTITGLVKNPRDGQPLSKVTATAFLFAADGTFLASGRAPLDFTVLRPGDESGFVINVPVNGVVARYRLGFRSEDGRIIGHVDRRGASTMASADSVNNGS
jgi:hypothetical protein